MAVVKHDVYVRCSSAIARTYDVGLTRAGGGRGQMETWIDEDKDGKSGKGGRERTLRGGGVKM